MIKIIFFLSLFYIQNAFTQYSSPESVTYDSTGKRYLISNTSSSKIVQRSQTGVVTDFVTVGGSIHGVSVYDNKVFVCNGSSIKGYELSTTSSIFNTQIAGSTFLNDIAISGSGIAYVSDFSARRIYKINLNTGEYWIYVSNTVNTPNGLYVDAARNRLLICCWGSNAPVKAVNLSDSAISNVASTSYSNCDGISLDRNDNVYISSWGIQSVIKFDINFSNSPVVVASGLSNPADIYVNKITDTLAVPNASSNSVSFLYINTSSITSLNQIVPEQFSLYQNYPNPFNPVTIIGYKLSVSGFVSLKVYNMLGNKVATLINEKQSNGSYSVEFDSKQSEIGGNLPSGVYFYDLTVDGVNIDRKSMLLIK